MANGRRYVLLLLLAVAAVLDASIQKPPWSLPGIAGIAVAGLAMAVFIFWPRIGGWVFLAAITVINLIPQMQVGALAFLVMAVLFDWGWHKHGIDLVLGTVIVAASYSIGASGEYVASIIFLLLLAFSGVSGFAVRYYLDQRDAAVKKLWEEKTAAANREQEYKDSVATQLHDSLAGTLSVLASLSENISREIGDTNPAVRDKVEMLGTQTREALGELRSMIQILDRKDSNTEKPLSPVDSLQRAKSLIEGFELELRTDFQPSTFTNLPKLAENLFNACLRESVTNLIKYAKPGSTCTISVNRSSETLEYMAKNQVSGVLRDAVMSSGRGLSILHKKLVEAGGQLKVWEVNGWWYFNADIPLAEGGTHGDS